MTRAEELTRAHRRAQLALRAGLLRDVLKLWPLLDLNNISRTWPGFESAMVSLIRSRGGASATVARRYYQQVREAAGIEGDPPPIKRVSTDHIRNGLVLVGPVNAGAQISKARPMEEVRKATLVNVSGEASRHVFNFGRLTLLGGLAFDRGGWRRATDTDPCPWCASDAMRTHPASHDFKAHRHCACFPQPTF